MNRQEAKERTRNSLLDSAAHEFAQRGLNSARINEIVERAGSSKGAMYSHFPAKEDLARALVDEKHDVWPTLVNDLNARGLRGLAAIRELCRQVAVLTRDDIRLRAAMRINQEVRGEQPLGSQYFAWQDVFTRFLQQSLADGEVKDTVDIRELAFVIVECAWGVVVVTQESGLMDEVELHLDRMWGHLLDNLRP